MRSAMMRQMLLTPCAAALAVAAAAAGAFAAATSPASTAPPGPEPRTTRRSTPRSPARRRALGDAATNRAEDRAAGTTAAAPLPAGAFWLSTYAMTSAFSMRPLGVVMRVRSTPCCSASLRASGEAFTAPVEPAADEVLVGAANPPVPAGVVEAPASPAAKISAIVLPTGTTSPTPAVTSRNTPEAGASTSTVTLSVSISTMGSPFCTVSPGDLIHFKILPVSCASSSAGMMTVVGISASTRQAREDLAGHGQRPLDPRGVDVQMRDRPDRVRPERAHADAVGEQVLHGLRRVRGRLEEHDVRLDARGIQANAGQPREPLGQPPRVGVIVGQTLDVMPERVDAARGDDAGLAHGAAHLLLAAPRLVDERARAGHGRADRRAEALGEIDPRRVERRREVAGGHAAGDDGVHEPRPVEMRRQPVPARRRRDLVDARERPHRAAAEIARLLHPQEPAPREVAIRRPHRGLHRRRVVLAARPVDRAHVDAGQRAGPARLEVDRVRRRVRDDLLAGPRVHAQRDLVAHGAGRQEHRGVLAEQLGHHLAEQVDGRVLQLLLVAHLRLAHDTAHVGGGPRDGVAIEVDVDPHAQAFRHMAFAASKTDCSVGTVRSSSTGENGTGTSMAPMRLTGASRK